MVRIVSYSLCITAALIISGCPVSSTYAPITVTTGSETKGRVLNAENDMPIQDVVVLALWEKEVRGLHGTTNYCLHAESAVTDKDGYWQIHKESRKEKRDGAYFFNSFYIYKPGFKAPRGLNDFKGIISETNYPLKKSYAVLLYNSDKWVDVKDLQMAEIMVGYGNQYLIPALQPDFDLLEIMLNSSRCLAKDGSELQLLPFLNAIRTDVVAHAKTLEEKQLLERVDDDINNILGKNGGVE